MSACQAAFKVDPERISYALESLRIMTDNLSEQEIVDLNNAGYLPTGIMDYLLAVRKVRIMPVGVGPKA